MGETTNELFEITITAPGRGIIFQVLYDPNYMFCPIQLDVAMRLHLLSLAGYPPLPPPFTISITPVPTEKHMDADRTLTCGD